MSVRSALLTVFLAALCGCPATYGTRTRSLLRAPADPSREAYADELVARARSLSLAHGRPWMRLGHYRSTWTGNVESEAEGDNFFLSPHGRGDPDAELEATIRGFFADLAPFDDKDKRNANVQHPICQFPARWMYLTKALSIDTARVGVPECPRYQEFVTSLHAKSATLVFSSYYLNNPASAFGHTFLRLNKREEGIAEDHRQLLDYGIDYSAAVDTTFAPIYAIKGILGMFPGVFGKIPFYYKVREYNDYESRDLWEYDLTLSEDEVAMLIAHVWELGSTFFRYYYLTANCSYHVLGLVEVARPSLSLLDGLHTPVLPADTVKVLSRIKGLVADVRFRPSLRTTFRARIEGLSSKQRGAVDALSTNPDRKLEGFTDRERIEIFDAAQDLIDLRHAKEIISVDRTGPADALKQRLLERRAEVLVPSHDLDEPPPWQQMPQLGHASRRISLGFTGAEAGARWLNVGARLALHDLLDPPTGYPELSELEFLPTRLRWDLVDGGLRLDQLDLVHIRSITGQDRFDRHISWEARLGSERRVAGCDCVAFHIQLGGGGALASAREAVALYFLAQTHVWISGPLDGIEGTPFGAGIGPSAGLRLRLARSLVSLATAEWLWLPDQVPDRRFKAEVRVRWSPVRNWALEVAGSDEEGLFSAGGSTSLYF